MCVCQALDEQHLAVDDCVSVCNYVCLSVCLYVCLSCVCQALDEQLLAVDDCVSLYLYVCIYVCLSICRCVYLSVCVSVRRWMNSTWLSTPSSVELISARSLSSLRRSAHHYFSSLQHHITPAVLSYTCSSSCSVFIRCGLQICVHMDFCILCLNLTVEATLKSVVFDNKVT